MIHFLLTAALSIACRCSFRLLHAHPCLENCVTSSSKVLVKQVREVYQRVDEHGQNKQPTDTRDSGCRAIANCSLTVEEVLVDNPLWSKALAAALLIKEVFATRRGRDEILVLFHHNRIIVID